MVVGVTQRSLLDAKVYDLAHDLERAQAVPHSDDHGVAKLGYSVRPPSTKIVCPVM